LSRTLGVSARGAGPPVQWLADGDGLTVRCQSGDAALEHHQPGSFPSESFATPFALLRRCEGARQEPVVLTRRDDTVEARWEDAGIPQTASFDVLESPELPRTPARMLANGPDLLVALREAAQTADATSTRYALSCLRLRGQGGQIAATDGRQLLMQDGFAFPWEDDLLVPASRFFACAEFFANGSIHVGRSEQWVTLTTGAWTHHLRINPEGRFPPVENIAPSADRAVASLRLSRQDAGFLAQAIPRLPASDEANGPLTLDLNGEVAVRAQAPAQEAPTEVVLAGSHRQGEPIRIHTNRRYLARALRLGFQELHLFGAESPIVCRDERRTYLWALLSQDAVLPPHPHAVRIVAPSLPAITETRRSKRSPRSPVAQRSVPAAAERAQPRAGRELTTLRRQTQLLGATLVQALAQTRQVMAQLRACERSGRLSESTANQPRRAPVSEA
jgi:hypothetical protein